MRPEMAIILFDAFVGFALPLAFAIWQLRSVNRELERDRRKAAGLETEEPEKAEDSPLYRIFMRNAPKVERIPYADTETAPQTPDNRAAG